MFMKQESIRTTVDIPAPLYRKLKEQAAGTGSSIRELVLLGVRRVILQAQRPRPKRVEFPLIISAPPVDLTNEQIYEHVECPWCQCLAGAPVEPAYTFRESPILV